MVKPGAGRNARQAQADLDRWASSVADRRRRGQSTVAQLVAAEPLLALPAAPFPAILEVVRQVSRQALVAFEGNRYSVGPELAGQTVRVRARLGELGVEILAASGATVARHRRAPTGAVAPALEQAERERPSYAEFLDRLLGAEVEATEARRLERRLRLAGFPHHKTLEEFDFSAQPSLDRRLIDELATLRFVEERSNVLLVGPPGVAKTMLAIGLGLRAVHAGHRDLLHDRRRPRRPHLTRGDRGELADDDALLETARRS